MHFCRAYGASSQSQMHEPAFLSQGVFLSATVAVKNTLHTVVPSQHSHISVLGVQGSSVYIYRPVIRILETCSGYSHDIYYGNRCLGYVRIVSQTHHIYDEHPTAYGGDPKLLPA